jgi:hypothetical protein
MYRTTIRCIAGSIVLSLFIFITASCQNQKVTSQEDVYTIKPHPTVKIYGMEIDKIFSKKFSEIEKELNTKIKIDKEVSTILIRKDKNFVLKIRDQILNTAKDHIDILYGPVDNLSLYDNPGSVLPRSIIFYGMLSMSEPAGSKQTIVKELATMLPQSNTAKEILDKINSDFIAGLYREGKTLKINFDLPGRPVAYFFITFSDKGQLVYRYVFSRDKVVYPYL